MSKLFLLSTVIALLVIPVRASRGKNDRRALRQALVWLIAFNLFYVFGLYFLYGRL